MQRDDASCDPTITCITACHKALPDSFIVLISTMDGNSWNTYSRTKLFHVPLRDLMQSSDVFAG